MAKGLPILILFLLLLLGPSHAQLYDGDLHALMDIRSSLADLPGSSFFDSWIFDFDPCGSFMGVVCDFVDGALRVRELNLGTGLSDSPGLHGWLHMSLGDLAALRQLTVAPGSLGGQIPDSLGSLFQLEFLGISKNRISGSIPHSLTRLKNLRTLDLSFNKLTGFIPKGLGKLPNLEALVLGHNNLVGEIPDITSPLIHLDLRENTLSGDLPDLPISLNYLCISRNELSGNLANVAFLTNLYYLDLSFNKLRGSLPSSILGFKLQSLLLERNILSGNVDPPTLVGMDILDLSYNSFSGQLSPLLSTAANIYLDHNRFSGEVPQEFVDQLLSGNLLTLYLQHNFLTKFPVDRTVLVPVTSSLCIQYNCMEIPLQSHCPANVGNENRRPEYECIQSNQQQP